MFASITFVPNPISTRVKRAHDCLFINGSTVDANPAEVTHGKQLSLNVERSSFLISHLERRIEDSFNKIPTYYSHYD